MISTQDDQLINFQSALTELGDKVAIIDREYTIIFQNTLCQKVHDSKIGIKCHEGFRSQDTICPDCPAQQVFLGQGSIKTEHLCTGNGHDEQWVELVASPLTNKEGETIAATIVQRDVTASKRMMAEKDLLVRQLQEVLSKPRRLNGSATIGMFCTTSRDEQQDWIPAETPQTQQEQHPPPGRKPAENRSNDCCPGKLHKPQTAASSIKTTPREQEVLLLVARGYTSKSMGERLGLSSRTIERHRANLLKKFSQKNSASLIQIALRQGLL